MNLMVVGSIWKKQNISKMGTMNSGNKSKMKIYIFYKNNITQCTMIRDLTWLLQQLLENNDNNTPTLLKNLLRKKST